MTPYLINVTSQNTSIKQCGVPDNLNKTTCVIFNKRVVYSYNMIRSCNSDCLKSPTKPILVVLQQNKKYYYQRHKYYTCMHQKTTRQIMPVQKKKTSDNRANHTQYTCTQKTWNYEQNIRYCREIDKYEYYQCYCRDQNNYYSTIQHAMSQQVTHEKGVTHLLLLNVDMR